MAGPGGVICRFSVLLTAWISTVSLKWMFSSHSRWPLIPHRGETIPGHIVLRLESDDSSNYLKVTAADFDQKLHYWNCVALIYIYVHIIPKLLSFCLKKKQKKKFFLLFSKCLGLQGALVRHQKIGGKTRKKIIICPELYIMFPTVPKRTLRECPNLCRPGGLCLLSRRSAPSSLGAAS